MQEARPLHLLELFADDVDALADQPPVGLDLRFARAAEKAEAAALALKVGPRPDQAAFLIDEMGELDLEAPFPRPRALPENLQDETGAVEHLGVPRRLEVPLLDRRERMIDDDELGVLGADETRELLDLASAEQSGRPWVRNGHEPARLDVEIDGGGETDRLIEARLRRSLGSRRPFGLRARPPRLASRTGASTTAFARPAIRASPRLARGPLLLALQLSRVGRTQLLTQRHLPPRKCLRAEWVDPA